MNNKINLKGIGSIIVAGGLITTLGGCSSIVKDTKVSYIDNIGEEKTIELESNKYFAMGETKQFDAYEHAICLEDIGMNKDEVSSIEGYDIRFTYNNKTFLLNTEEVVAEEYLNRNDELVYPYPGVVVKEKNNDKTYELSK